MKMDKSSLKKKGMIYARVLSIIAGLIIIGLIFYFTGEKGDALELTGPFLVKDSNGNEKVYNDRSDYNINLKKGDWVEISSTIDNYDDSYNAILFSVNFCQAELSIDDKVIYTDSRNLDDAMYKSHYSRVAIDKNYSGSKLTIKYTAADRVQIRSIPIISITDMNKSYVNYIHKNLIKISMAVILIFMGIVLIIFEVIQRNYAKSYVKMFILALCSISAGAWILSLIRLMDICGFPLYLIYWFEYISLFLTVSFATYYFSYTDGISSRIKKGFRYSARFQIIFILIASILNLSSLVSFHAILPLYHVFIIAGIIIIACMYIKEIRKQHISEIVITGAIVIVLFVTLMDFYGYYFANNEYTFSNSIMPYLVIILISILVADYIHSFVKMYTDKVQLISLENMAYTDAITKLANRNKCEKYFHEINEKSIGKFEIIMFDINGLKYVNDTFGHQYGDELIENFAKALKNVFVYDDIFVGRMGGDEFVAIIEEDKIEKTQEYLDNLNKYTEYINESNIYKYTIKYSYGISICDRTRNNDIWKSFSKADSSMYQMKR